MCLTVWVVRRIQGKNVVRTLRVSGPEVQETDRGGDTRGPRPKNARAPSPKTSKEYLAAESKWRLVYEITTLMTVRNASTWSCIGFTHYKYILVRYMMRLHSFVTRCAQRS